MTRHLGSLAVLLLAASILAADVRGHGGVVPPTGGTGAPGGYKGPGDAPPRPAGPATSGPASPSGPATGGPSPGAGGPKGPATGGPPGVGVATGGSDPYGFATWEAWWHFNKDPFLELKRAVASAVVTSGGEDTGVSSSGLPSRDLVHGKIVPALGSLLETERANDIQTGVLVALARIGDRESTGEDSSAVSHLVRALADPNQEVSETAALALGILRSEAAIPHLADLLEGGARGGKLVGSQEVPVRTRAFAAFALGLASERAPANRTRQMIARVLFEALDEPRHRRDVEVAAVLALSLDRLDVEPVESASAPWISRQTVVRHLLAVFAESKRDHLVRAHTANAVARLSRGAPPALRAEAVQCFVVAMRKASKLEKEVVHSCIQALGELADAGASAASRDARAALLRALDESDPQSRAFALIALAEVGARPAGLDGSAAGDDPDAASPSGPATGGPSPGGGKAPFGELECRSALVNEILRGRSTSKPWAALALGVHERRRADRGGEASDPARAVLRDWLGSARGRNEIGSGAIALGLCREPRAAALLRSKLADTNEDTGQGYVALALGMIGARDAVPALRDVVRSARYRPVLLEQSAAALALLGDRDSGPEIARLLGEARGSAAQASLASALGFVGDARSVEPLLVLIARKDLPASARGLAAAALGRVADESPLPWHASISCGLNYRAATPSLFAGDGTGLLEIL